MAVTSTSLGMSTVPLPLESLIGLSLPRGAPNVMNLFIMIQSLSLCLTGMGGEDRLLQESS
jgi:hypothetical protein